VRRVDWQQGALRSFIHLTVNIAARDIDTFRYRLGYMLILIGDVVQISKMLDRAQQHLQLICLTRHRIKRRMMDYAF